MNVVKLFIVNNQEGMQMNNQVDILGEDFRIVNESRESYLKSTEITHALVVHNWAAYDFHIVEWGSEKKIDDLLKKYNNIATKISYLVGNVGKIWFKGSSMDDEFPEVDKDKGELISKYQESMTEDSFLAYIYSNVSASDFLKVLELKKMLKKIYGENVLRDYSDLYFTKVEFKR